MAVLVRQLNKGEEIMKLRPIPESGSFVFYSDAPAESPDAKAPPFDNSDTAKVFQAER